MKLSKAKQLLPVVALGQGVSGKDWASAFLEVRRELGRDASVGGLLGEDLHPKGPRQNLR